MATQRHLRNAPIREALVDIRFAPEVPIEHVDRWVMQWAADHGEPRQIWEGSLALKLNAGGVVGEQAGAPIGRRVDLEERQEVVQFCRNRLTFSKLPKYDDWDAMSERALAIWSEYSEAMGATETTRIAVRYINGIELPLPLPEDDGFSHYLSCPPLVPDELPQTLSGFVSRVMIGVDKNTTAAVSQVLEGEGDGGKTVKLLLDIDVFENRNAGVRVDEIRPALARLRKIKNDAFFGFLTEATVRRYE